MLDNKSTNKIALIIIILQLIVVFSFAFQKQGFKNGEISSFILANSYTEGGSSFSNDLYDKWIESEYFSKLITVSEGARFSYSSVFINQSNDVHPPIYYVILHTICSLFPENFSKWYGLSINIFFFILCNLFIFLISKKLFLNHSLNLLPSIIWGFSAGAISTAIFIRMYMMLTSLILIFVYFHFVLIEKEESNKTLFCIYIITLLGFMTHYYFLIFTLIWAFHYFPFWIIQKNWNMLINYIETLFAALLIGFFIFPSSFNHILLGYRGEEAIENIVNISNFSERFNIMFSILSTQQFYGLLSRLIIILTCLFLVRIVRPFIIRLLDLFKGSNNLHALNKPILPFHLIDDFYVENIRILSLTISVVATFIVITLTSPYPSSRYIFFIYPFVSVLAVFCIYQICKIYIKNNKIIILGILLLFTIITTFSYKNNQVEHLYVGYDEIISNTQNYKNYNCIYVTNNLWKAKSNIFELLEFKRTYFLKNNNISNISELLKDINNDKGIILYIEKIQNQEFVLKNFLLLSDFNNYNFLYSTRYSMSYFIY